MNKNIVTLIFLAFMITAAGFSIHSYSQLQKEKKANQDLLVKLEKTDAINKDLKQRTDSINRELTKLILSADSNSHQTDSKWNTEKTTLIRELKTVNETYTKVNNLSAYQQAYELEKEGFEALTKNNFKLALTQITLAEKTSPGFHMSFEISNLLGRNYKGFDDAETQKDIKREIIEKFSWKAPEGPLQILKDQLKDDPNKTKPKAIPGIKWPVKKNY